MLNTEYIQILNYINLFSKYIEISKSISYNPKSLTMFLI